MFNKLFDLPEKKKFCEDCGEDITGTHAKRKVCGGCEAKRNKEYRTNYVDDHRELINSKMRDKYRLKKSIS